MFHITAFPYPDMIDPKTIYLTGEAAKFHKPGKSFYLSCCCFIFVIFELTFSGFYKHLLDGVKYTSCILIVKCKYRNKIYNKDIDKIMVVLKVVIPAVKRFFTNF